MKDIEQQQPPSWSYVCEHFGLDTSFQYSDAQRAEYYRLLDREPTEQDAAGENRKIPGLQQPKWFIGVLKERNGEQEYIHKVLLQVCGAPSDTLRDIAQAFYDDVGEPSDDGFYHDGGTRFVAPSSVTYVDAKQAEVLGKVLAVYRDDAAIEWTPPSNNDGRLLDAQAVIVAEPVSDEIQMRLSFEVGALDRDSLEDIATDFGIDFDKWTTSDELREDVLEKISAQGYPHRKFEYDDAYWGGEYTGTGQAAYVPESLITLLGDEDLAFSKFSHRDPIHIVSVDREATYRATGEAFVGIEVFNAAAPAARKLPQNAIAESETVRWSAWFDNPFKAIKAAAEACGKPEDHVRALDVLRASAEWENFDLKSYLDDVLQEIAGETNIVCQYHADSFSERRFRAAYDEVAESPT